MIQVMVQLIGAFAVLVAVLIAAWWVWTTWFSTTAVGKTTVGKYVTAALESANLTVNLGYVELLSHVDAVEASPEATAACGVIADTLWAAAKDAWKRAQTTGLAPAATTPTPTIEQLWAAVVELKAAAKTTGTIPAASVNGV